MSSATAFITTGAVADDYRIEPSLRLEIQGTDNVRNTNADRQPDAILEAIAGLDLSIDTRRTDVEGGLELRGEKFAVEEELDNYRLDGSVVGNFKVYRDIIGIDGLARVSQEFIDNSAGSATGHATGEDRLQITYWDVSPYLQTEFIDFWDVTLRGRYGIVAFSDPSDSFVGIRPEDATITQGSLFASTGDRIDIYQMAIAAQYVEDDLGFESYNGIYSLSIELVPKVSIVGRGGYESVSQPGVIDINGITWSAGFIYAVGPKSLIRVEGGERFDDIVWDGEMNLKLTPWLFLFGKYAEAIESQQLRLGRTIGDILDPDDPLDPFDPDFLDEDLLDETFRVRDATFRLSYIRHLHDFSLQAGYVEREILSLDATETNLNAQATLRERIRPDLTAVALVSYETDIETRPLDVPSTTWRTNWKAEYQMLADVTISGEYIWRKTFFENGIGVPENAVVFAIEQRF